MNETEFFEKYCEFVKSTTSECTTSDDKFFAKAKMMSQQLGGQYARLDTAIAGMAGETGEIADIWKKIKFQDKELSEENIDDLLHEIGDLYWYLAQASMALGVSPEKIIEMNVEKLKKRHPHGFSTAYFKEKK